MSPQTVGYALLLLGVILIVGKIIRVKVHWVQRLFLPSAIVGGFIALFLGPDVFGAIMKAFGYSQFAEGGFFGKDVLSVWKTLPGLLISVVFATLFLGQEIPSFKKVARLAGPQLSLGIAFASGQYVIGLALVIFLLVPLLGIDPMAGALIEIGYEGGHGTAAGMAPVFKELGWEDGASLAIGVATVGLVGGIVVGVLLINWAIRTGRTKVVTEAATLSAEEQAGLFREDEQYVAARMTSRTSSIEPLSLHVAIVALAVLIGQAMLSGMQWVEKMLWIDQVKLLGYVPLFPLAMIGGAIIQVILKKIGYAHIVDDQMMLRVQGLALDILVVAALASLSLKAISANWVAFTILCVGGMIINLLVLLVMCPKTIPHYWFERGIGDFGQATGVTATGLILMRIVDPEGKSPAFKAFGYKQLIFEPFFGGGLITALSVPMIHSFGPWPWFLIMSAVLIFAVTTGVFYWGPLTKNDPPSAEHGVEYPPHEDSMA